MVWGEGVLLHPWRGQGHFPLPQAAQTLIADNSFVGRKQYKGFLMVITKFSFPGMNYNYSFSFTRHVMHCWKSRGHWNRLQFIVHYILSHFSLILSRWTAIVLKTKGSMINFPMIFPLSWNSNFSPQQKSLGLRLWVRALHGASLPAPSPVVWKKTSKGSFRPGIWLAVRIF